MQKFTTLCWGGNVGICDQLSNRDVLYEKVGYLWFSPNLSDDVLTYQDLGQIYHAPNQFPPPGQP